MGDELRGLILAAGHADRASGWGWIGLVASERGLRMVSLPAKDRLSTLQTIQRHYPEVALAPDHPFLRAVAEQIQAYLAGERREFQVELDLRGHTTFELSVWAATVRIPHGETRTYGWVAAQVAAHSGAAQAVGAALGSNPVPLIVPCHRVIGADGSLHGFAGGLDMKARLLALESRQMALPLTMEGAV